ncbi:MAG: NepR family anti-sigma factor [Maricaulaceae bacterium]
MAERHTPGADPVDPDALDERQRRVGDRLKKLFDSVLHEPVPQEFLDLLNDADSKAQTSDPEPEDR